MGLKFTDEKEQEKIVKKMYGDNVEFRLDRFESYDTIEGQYGEDRSYRNYKFTIFDSYKRIVGGLSLYLDIYLDNFSYEEHVKNNDPDDEKSYLSFSFPYVQHMAEKGDDRDDYEKATREFAYAFSRVYEKQYRDSIEEQINKTFDFIFPEAWRNVFMDFLNKKFEEYWYGKSYKNPQEFLEFITKAIQDSRKYHKERLKQLDNQKDGKERKDCEMWLKVLDHMENDPFFCCNIYNYYDKKSEPDYVNDYYKMSLKVIGANHNIKERDKEIERLKKIIEKKNQIISCFGKSSINIHEFDELDDLPF